MKNCRSTLVFAAFAFSGAFGASAEDQSVAAGATPIVSGTDGFKAQVRPFFNTYCIKCHGPTKSKGQLALHTLDGNLSSGSDVETWESILDMLEIGEMPPNDEPQPKKAEAQAVIKWIESGKVPLANLVVSMLNAVDVPVEKFADSIPDECETPS